jgi:putative inorganic carbon (hco3(-)) transporter
MSESPRDRPLARGNVRRPICEVLLLSSFACWFLYLFLASTNGFGWIDSWHNEQRAVQLVLLASTAPIMLLAYVQSTAALPVFAWPIWFLAAIGFVSALFADFRWAAVAEVSLFISLAGLVLASELVCRSLRRCPLWFVRCVLLLAAAHCVGILVRYGAAISLKNDLTTDVLLLGFANPRFASSLYVLLMPFLAHHVLCAEERRDIRAAAFAVLTLLWAFNLALGTRAVIFGIGLGLAGYALFRGRRAPLSIAWTMMTTAVVGAVLYAVMFHLVPSWVAGSGSLAIRADPVLGPNGRDLLLGSSVAAIRGAPVLGIGPTQFAAIPHVWAAHPHNWVLQLAAEYGLPSTSVLLFCLVAWFWRLRERLGHVSADSGTLFEPALLMTLIGLAYGLVDGNLIMPISQTAAAIGLGAMLASLPPGLVGTTTNSVNRYATGVAFAAAAGVVALYGYTSFAEQETSVKRFREAYAKDRFFVPRFWEQGLLIKPGQL